MKNTFLIALLAFTALSFSQEKKIFKNGYITFNSNSIMEFDTLFMENESVVFVNKVTKTEMNFPLTSIKQIMDVEGTIVYESKSVPIVKKVPSPTEVSTNNPLPIRKEENEKLEYHSASKMYMNGEVVSQEKLESLLKTAPSVYDQYSKGKKGATLGSILLGGGIGLFIGGGLSNLIAADNGGGGSPALLVVGIVTSIVGIPVRLGGVKNIKESINTYNALPKKQVSFMDNPELKILTGWNGVGLQLRF